MIKDDYKWKSNLNFLNKSNIELLFLSLVKPCLKVGETNFLKIKHYLVGRILNYFLTGNYYEQKGTSKVHTNFIFQFKTKD